MNRAVSPQFIPRAIHTYILYTYMHRWFTWMGACALTWNQTGAWIYISDYAAICGFYCAVYIDRTDYLASTYHRWFVVSLSPLYIYQTRLSPAFVLINLKKQLWTISFALINQTKLLKLSRITESQRDLSKLNIKSFQAGASLNIVVSFRFNVVESLVIREDNDEGRKTT